MRLKLDENLGSRGAKMLTQMGHDVTTVVDEGLSSADDRQLVETCRNERRCLVTLDLDFSNPLVFDPSHYAGIAVLRLPPSPTPTDIVDVLRTLVGGLERDSIEGKLWVIQRGRIREYQPEEDSYNQ